MHIRSFFHWLGTSWLGTQMSQSTYGFAIVEMIHLVALALLGGVILLIDLRVLGLGYRKLTAQNLARELSPILLGGLAAMLVSGFLLVASEAMKCYANPAFRLKMLLFAIAVVFRFGLHGRLVGRNSGELAWLTKASAVCSLLLWLAVGLAGRAIGFV